MGTVLCVTVVATLWALGMRSAAYLNTGYSGMRAFFFPDGTDIFPDDSGGIDQAQTVKEVFRRKSLATTESRPTPH